MKVWIIANAAVKRRMDWKTTEAVSEIGFSDWMCRVRKPPK